MATGPVKEKCKERTRGKHAYLYVLKVRNSVRTVSHNPLGFAFSGSRRREALLALACVMATSCEEAQYDVSFAANSGRPGTLAYS